MAPKKKKEKEHHCGAGATFMIGRAIAKDFKGHGTFTGRVTEFNCTTGYRVEYEDGDAEDFTEVDLVRAARSRTWNGQRTRTNFPRPFPHLVARVPLSLSFPLQIPLLVNSGPISRALAEVETVSNLSKRAAPPSVTLREYVTAARSTAKRKLKHTELKRSGILEAKRIAAEAAREAAAREAAERMPLAPPPAWAEGMARDGRMLHCDGAPEVEPAMLDHDVSLFRTRALPPPAPHHTDHP